MSTMQLHSISPPDARDMAGSRFSIIRPRAGKKGLFWITPDEPQSAVFRRLGRDRQVTCLRAPTQSSAAQPPTLEQLAHYYADSVENAQESGPVSLAGFCIAAVLAREVAIELLSRGRTVRALIMIDPPDPAKSRAKVEPDRASDAMALQARRIAFHARRVFSMPLGDALRYLRGSLQGVLARVKYERGRVAHAAAISSGQPIRDEFASSYQTSVAAFLNAVPREYPGSALLIRPVDVPPGAFSRADRRWEQLIVGGLQFARVAGDSGSMWLEPSVTELGDTISRCLEQ